MVVAVARRLGLIGRSGSDGVIRWLVLRPKGRGNAVFRNFNPHRWTDPDDPRVTRALILRGGLERLEFGKKYLLPWFMTEIQFPNTTSGGFDCIPIYGDIVVWGINAVYD